MDDLDCQFEWLIWIVDLDCLFKPSSIETVNLICLWIFTLLFVVHRYCK